MSDAQFRRIAKILISERGRLMKNPKATLEGIMDRYQGGYQWRKLPSEYGHWNSVQLLADTRAPIPAQPGQPRRQDYEYRRAGMRNIFLTCEPLAGWRNMAITQRRTMQDFAHQMRWLVDEAYRNVPVVRVVLDNPYRVRGRL